MMRLKGGQVMERIQGALREKFSTLWWVPETSKERMWKARRRQTTTMQHILPEGHTEGGVWITINPRYFNPAWMTI